MIGSNNTHKHDTAQHTLAHFHHIKKTPLQSMIFQFKNTQNNNPPPHLPSPPHYNKY